jgi:hypothetical protein
MEIKQFAQSINACDVHDYSGDQVMSKRESSWARRPKFRRGHYFVLELNNETYFLIMKISRSYPPFWGVGENNLNYCLKFSKTHPFLILLDSDHSGWVYSKNDINQCLKLGNWSYSNRDHKINRNNVTDKIWFNSKEGFFDILMKAEFSEFANQ